MGKFILLSLYILVIIPLAILGLIVGCDSEEKLDTTHLTPTEITFGQTYDLLDKIKITINENQDHPQATQWKKLYLQYRTTYSHYASMYNKNSYNEEIPGLITWLNGLVIKLNEDLNNIN